MRADHFKEHLNSLREQSSKLNEALSEFKSNYHTLQFGLQRLENELRKSRDMFEQMTLGTIEDTQIIQLTSNKEDNADRQLTA
ncbi:hypothetical protein CKK33_11000 [Mucilaginibacter sp. MD40]|uniref:hypothetical protein n=1 Tax=Mucilaginibacter sp. MD40 TaxID=2029590 RepID=UPI000BACB822|nr:hypothetical protein [Mucilaginibacter sp. MD40]PAW93993.1 hypothetical protein CKK33_11000 [Mucilaginibacter sp. MD40]